MKILVVSGIIGYDVTAADVREFLKGAAGEDVEVHFATPGGLVSQGLEMYALLRDYPGTVYGKVMAYAMSMGSYLLQACDHRAARRQAVYMIHNARGGVWGDHNEILKYGHFVKGLSGLLGKRYVKATGKTSDEIQRLMDEESFFFGDEILEHGFVDVMLDDDDDEDTDKESAIFSARAVFTDAVAKLHKDTEQARVDMDRASAMMNLSILPPAAAGPTKKEDQRMNLAELLAQNPAAKAEFDGAVAAARADGEKAGSDAMKAVIAKVAPLLESGSYPPTITRVAIAVLKGDEAVGVLTTAVASVDAVREELKGKEAGLETGKQPPTPPAPVVDPTTPTGQAGVIASDADLDAAIAQAKGGN